MVLHPRVPAEHVRQAALDRFGAEAATPRRAPKRNAGLPPHNYDFFGLLAWNRPPANLELGAILTKGSMLAGVGGKLVKCHAQGLRDLRGKTQIRPGQQDAAAIVSSVRLQLLTKGVLEPDAYGRSLGQQLLGTRKRQEPCVECLGKLLQTCAGLCGLRASVRTFSSMLRTRCCNSPRRMLRRSTASLSSASV